VYPNGVGEEERLRKEKWFPKAVKVEEGLPERGLA
jgi:hypothetical protein